MTPRKRTAERIRGVSREIDAAKLRLRRQSTPAEKRPWEALRDSQLAGLKFRRQHALGPMILDFCCTSLRFVIELDVTGHDCDEQRERDRARAAHRNAYGYHVIRFRNDEVLDDLECVLGRILASVSPSQAYTGSGPAVSLPSPSIGRGAGGEGP
ncbi:MAG TPA: endonuclease domain-containing protein [Dehalococcoidia bacterium]|nr:endonuclease domain-containing protein [Dehalococcoidia bacterium]